MRATPGDWQHAFKLADEALDLPPAEFERWMGALAEEHVHLAPMLREMFAAHAKRETNNFLNTLPHVSMPPELLGAGAASGLAAGTSVGPYRLMREIGVGGMGTVWLAERADGTIKREVALKLPYAGPFQKQIAERFALERDILAGLTHKNIARLYDAGATESGQPYLAMEYVPGLSIIDYCDTNRLSIPQRLQLFRQVLSAVQYAHANLVLHRDLKPSNILVNNEGTASLLDFGIAKLMTDGETKASALTQVSGSAFTPDYASPEQVSGAPLSTASDVYSLGVILYEVLSGTRPYKLKRGTRAELEEAITSVDATRPSSLVNRQRTVVSPQTNSAAHHRQTTAKKLASLLMGDLDTIVLKALKKNPADRYATVAALDEDLARHQRGDAVLARPESRWYRLQRFVARNQLVAGSVAAVVVALAAGMSVALWQANIARTAAEKARKAAEYSAARAEFWGELLADAAPNDPAAAFPSMPELLKQGESLIKKRYAKQPDVAAILYADLGRAHRNIVSYQSAIPFYEAWRAKSEEAFGPDSVGAKDARIGLLIRYARGMQLQRYFAMEDWAKAACTEQQNLTTERCIRSTAAKALAYVYAGRLNEIEAVIGSDIEIIRRAVKDDRGVLNALNGQLGKARMGRGDLLRGRQMALASSKNSTDPDPENCVQCLYEAVALMLRSDRVAAAQPFTDLFLSRHDAGVGEHAYLSNELLRTAARARVLNGDTDRGIALYQRTLVASRLNFGPDNADLAHTQQELAAAKTRSGNVEEARQLLRDVERIHQSIAPERNHWLSQARIALAGLDIVDGKGTATLDVLRAERAIAMRDHDDANLALALYWLARQADSESVPLATEALQVLRRGGLGRSLLALDVNLLLVDRASAVAAKQKHAARAHEIARYLFGAEHASALAVTAKLAARGLLVGTVAPDPEDIAMDNQIDVQDAEILAYANGIARALTRGKP